LQNTPVLQVVPPAAHFYLPVIQSLTPLQGTESMFCPWPVVSLSHPGRGPQALRPDLPQGCLRTLLLRRL